MLSFDVLSHIKQGSHFKNILKGRKEENVLFNDALNTFYLRLYGIRHMVKDHSDSERGNPMCHMGYSFRLAARVLLYAPSHRQDNTYHSLAGTRNNILNTLVFQGVQGIFPCYEIEVCATKQAQYIFNNKHTTGFVSVF